MPFTLPYTPSASLKPTPAPNWIVQKQIENFLQLTNLTHYIIGSIHMPGNDEPRAKENWQSNDDMVVGILLSSIEVSEWQHLTTNAGSHACWKSIEAHHKNLGAISQVHLL